MDPHHLPFTVRCNNVERYLPTYEEANIPYSLRLPTYRSSYARRFHPYARFVSHPLREYDEHDEELEDPQDSESLDGSVLQLHDIVPTPSANSFVADSLRDREHDALPVTTEPVAAEHGDRDNERDTDTARQVSYVRSLEADPA
ncbi:hypothetical protein APHAL10511_000929 [Amanita phalloides]|nr:hypothetical protein APHAL10511_000929 [Amanita phalloides]